MTTPAVGPIVALTLCGRHRRPGTVSRSSKQIGAAFRPDAEEVSIGRDRLHRTDQQDRRCLGARGALRSRPCDADQAGQRLLGPQKLGDAHRQTSRHAQGQGGAGAQARRDHASHARRRQRLQSGCQGCSGLTRRNNDFRAGHDTRPSRSEVPSPGRWIRSDRNPGSGIATTHLVDWPTYPLCTPSGDGHAPIPDRSKSPAIG